MYIQSHFWIFKERWQQWCKTTPLHTENTTGRSTDRSTFSLPTQLTQEDS